MVFNERLIDLGVFDLSSMGDGIIFPQRHMDEDEDSLLGNRQRWMEEGGAGEADNSGDVTSPYRKRTRQVAMLNLLLTRVPFLSPPQIQSIWILWCRRFNFQVLVPLPIFTI